jgi:hypothetical protein
MTPKVVKNTVSQANGTQMARGKLHSVQNKRRQPNHYDPDARFRRGPNLWVMSFNRYFHLAEGEAWAMPYRYVKLLVGTFGNAQS